MDETDQRRATVAQLTADGVSQRQIARQLGVHHSTVQRDVEALAEDTLPDARMRRGRCEECAGPLPDGRVVVCSDECERDRRKRHRQARWRTDADWRAKRTMATAASLVKRHGTEAPRWAAELAGGAVVEVAKDVGDLTA